MAPDHANDCFQLQAGCSSKDIDILTFMISRCATTCKICTTEEPTAPPSARTEQPSFEPSRRPTASPSPCSKEEDDPVTGCSALL